MSLHIQLGTFVAMDKNNCVSVDFLFFEVFIFI